MIVRELVNQFLGWCSEHRAAATVKHYRSRLKPLVERFGERRLDQLTALAVDAHLRACGKFSDGRMKSPDTRRANAVAFEAFQSWCLRMKLMESPILARIEKPAGRLRERIPTEEETRKLLEQAGPEFARIYQALRQSGARPGELAAAKIEHITDSDGVRKIVLSQHKTARKTGRKRQIVIGEKLEKLIVEAVGERADGPIFLSPHGTAWTTQSLSRTYRSLRDKAGLPKDLCLYLARHEHATKLARARGIDEASRALGHANIQTTMRYRKFDDRELRDGQDSV